MAEALLRQVGGENSEAHSAGSIPSGIHPLTIRALAEIGIDAGGQYSKHWEVYLAAPPFDYVITVCDPDEQNCPLMPGKGERLHWPVEDPVGAVGTDEERMALFRRVREEIAGRVRQFIRETTGH